VLLEMIYFILFLFLFLFYCLNLPQTKTELQYNFEKIFKTVAQKFAI